MLREAAEENPFLLKPETQDTWLETAILVLKENVEFCGSNEAARETRIELAKLMNDGIDYIVWIMKFKDWHQIRTWSAIANYIFSLLFPLSQGIYLDFLTGNIPSCFMQLRMLIEQLAVCFQADLKYPGGDFFQEQVGEAGRQESVGSKSVKYNCLLGF